MKKWLMLAPALGLLTACGGGPTAPTPPANVAGSYDLTVTASTACSANLPAESRTLAFLANIAQTHHDRVEAARQYTERAAARVAGQPGCPASSAGRGRCPPRTRYPARA